MSASLAVSYRLYGPHLASLDMGPALCPWNRLCCFTFQSPVSVYVNTEDSGMAHVRTGRQSMLEVFLFRHEEESTARKL